MPSALDRDDSGNIYVGGVGGLAEGGASVVRLDADGEETERWDGFTGLNGLAVAEDGRHVYVSQIFGTDGPPTGTGNVVRFDTEAETWTSVEVPFPSGLALGTVASDADSVYVSAYSISPADDDDPATADATEGGQVWRFSFPDDATESALPVTTPAGLGRDGNRDPDRDHRARARVRADRDRVGRSGHGRRRKRTDDGTVGEGGAVAAPDPAQRSTGRDDRAVPSGSLPAAPHGPAGGQNG